jgi:hypothetical protein
MEGLPPEETEEAEVDSLAMEGSTENQQQEETIAGSSRGPEAVKGEKDMHIPSCYDETPRL